MVDKVDRTYSKDEVMGMMEPLISTWFNEKYEDLTIPQAKAIPVIHQRRNVLVSSPTGSGKTLTAFTSIINELTRYSREGTLEERVYCIYVSPLKALGNDVNRNLNTPLAEMREVAERHGMNIPNITVAVRSGDTSQADRQKMVRHPPHILITTPESLALILAAPKFKDAFKKVEWVILDEIHDICDSKRGAFLSLTLERLRRHCENEFVRIGLSATLAPIEEIAAYLVGCDTDGRPRDVALIESGSKKTLDLQVICPTRDLTTLSSDIVNSMMYDTLKELIDTHDTTLVFTNTRSGAESVVYKLKERGLENIEVHHSSLGKEIRLDVEERLKHGEVKCVVSSTSLELGIDIGSVDLVCQIGSPKSVAKGLQRIGRSGHSFGKVAKGRLLVFDPDDLVECAVMCRAAHRGDIDRVGIPENCLDVLSQTIVGMSLDNRWDIDDAYDLVKGSYCYRNLTKESFMQVIRYLGSKDDFEGVYSKIWYDEEENQFGKKKGSRMIYFMNLGTIPEEANYRVITNHGSVAGELSEKFVERLSPRDVFVLGGRSFEFVRSKGMTAYVKEANGRKPTVPSWAGEMLPRSFDLSMDVAVFRHEMASRISEDESTAIKEISEEFDVDEGSARSIYSYFKEQDAVAGFIPDDIDLAVEEYIDPSGNQKLVFHFPFGRRVNDALSRAYAHRLTGMLGANVSVTISDDSFMLGCPRTFDIEQIPGLIRSSELETVLRKSLKDSEIFKLRFRHTAARSFMILRNYMGRPISVNRQQVRSSYLLEALSGMENVPVIEETYREVMEDDMDIKNARYVLDLLDSGKMRLKLIHYSGTPSPFAHSAILSGFSDIVLMEDRSALLRELHRKVLYRALGDTVSEFEFTEDQVIPYFSQKPTRITCRDDIPRLLMETGPLQALRERGRNIYSYTDEDRKTVDGWIRELIHSGELGTVFLDEPHIMVADEIPFYAAATRKVREMNETDEAVYNEITMDVPLSDIVTKLEISEDMVIRSIRKLESMYLITRSDLSGNKWLFGRVDYPKIDANEATDRIVMRYLDCFAPASVQEVAYALSLTEDQAHASLESLVANEDVAKGRFLVSENDQYMLKIDHMRLKAGRANVFSYDAVENYRVSKGQHFDTIQEFFDFHGSAGSELDVYNRVKDFDLAQWYDMRKSGQIQLGRFVRGKVRFVDQDDANRYAAIRTDETSPEDMQLLNVISGMGEATLRQLVAETGMEKDLVRDSVMRLDRSLAIVRSFNEKEDWGTENTYAPFHPEKAAGNPAKDLLSKAIRAYGPIPASGLRYIVGIPLDMVEELAAEIGAKVVTVGDGQSPMYIMEDEIQRLEKFEVEKDYPVRLLSLYDPDLGSKWAEIAARYGDRWIYPLVKGTQIVGALEIWEMSGCIEVRSMDMDEPELMPDVLKAIDNMMGFYIQKGIDIVRIREVLSVDAEDLDDDKRKILEDNGYILVNGFYAKGRFDPWTMTDEQMTAYVFGKQRISKANKYPSVAECVAVRGYIRGDQEIMTRVQEKTVMKKQMERGYLMKMTLTPPYQGYTDSDHAHLFREMKGYVPDDDGKALLNLIAKKQPVSKKTIIADSPLSLERTNDLLNDMNKMSVLYQDSDSNYNIVPTKGLSQFEALVEVAKMHFRDFGTFTADDMSAFLASRMSVTRKVLRTLEDEGFVKKGFFVKDDSTLRWMLAEDVGKPVRRAGDSFILNTQDNLSIYMRDIIKAEVGSTKSVIIANNKIIGSFMGKICGSGAKVEDFQGTERASRMMKEAAQSVGMRLDTQRQREDDDWDVSEFYTKVNTGA